MYCPAVVVSILISLTSTPSSSVCIPRLSFTLSVTVAPRSMYELLISTSAGLLPCIVMVGGSLSVVFELLDVVDV